MTGRKSLLEQKKLQWAKEREEMARLGANWGPLRHSNPIRTTIRTYPTDGRMPLTDQGKEVCGQPFRANGHCGSTVSLRSLGTDSSENCTSSLKSLDFVGGSLIDLHSQTDVSQMRRRSPSLPPIYNKEQQKCFNQEQQQGSADLDLRFHPHKQQKQQYNYQQCHGEDRHESPKELRHNYGSPVEERGGETSGYASDSVEPPLPATHKLLPGCRTPGGDANEKVWQNPYYNTPENSLPPSRMLSASKMGELNRPRWGSVWAQDSARGDPPPPPSWLARLGQSSQVLVINHDSASSPDSSTTGSTGSDPNKTYLRGQNIQVDAQVLQEREARRQKAIELQNAIKQQLEEKDKKRREEKERRMREELLEEERIKREREVEKQRFEEEQKRLKEKEDAKLKQAKAMREVLEAAERLAKEEKKKRRKRIDSDNDEHSKSHYPVTNDSDAVNDNEQERNCESMHAQMEPDTRKDEMKEVTKNEKTIEVERVQPIDSHNLENSKTDNHMLQLPISKEVAIVLSGRLDDSELLKKANLQLVNLVVTPSLKNQVNSPRSLTSGINSLMASMNNPALVNSSSRLSPRIFENRLLTPSKYRTSAGRDFGTQTDLEDDLADLRDKVQAFSLKDSPRKEHRDGPIVGRRDVDKSTIVGHVEDIPMKTLQRSKPQQRTSLEARPRWNANRPGTRYRTQSEKDPHYQRRLRLRRRQMESSDEGSRSPSPHRRKFSNAKIKARMSARRKAKLDSYDADLSMDSLNSILPLRVDKDGMVNIEAGKEQLSEKTRFNDDDADVASRLEKSEKENSNVWCGEEILSKLNSLRNVMAFQLDDLLKDDKKDTNLIPDLSKATCNSQEEFRRLLERCPEFKIKTEKVKREDVKVRDKDFRWRATKKELKAIEREWAYGDPVPPDMRGLNLKELQQVPIDWRMLTSIRPKNRQDEEMFSRLVEMGKLQAKTIAREKRSFVSPIRRFKNRAGILESSVKICGDCGEEYCTGESCGDVLYDDFVRVTVSTQQPKVKVSADTEAIIAGMGRSKKKRKRKGVKGVRTPRKGTNLSARRKTRKSGKSNSSAKDSNEDNDGESQKRVKPFRRKCTKHAKKGLPRK